MRMKKINILEWEVEFKGYFNKEQKETPQKMQNILIKVSPQKTPHRSILRTLPFSPQLPHWQQKIPHRLASSQQTRGQSMIIEVYFYLFSLIFSYNSYFEIQTLHMLTNRSMNHLFSEIKIHFCIHKKVDFGQALYICGNLSQLGNWQIQNALKLQWNEDHYWSGVLVIPAYIYDSFHFKYVVSSFSTPNMQDAQWQHGSNRRVSIQNDKRCIVCNHKWNKEKVTLNLCVERSAQNEEYYVVGNISQLGRWKINNRMKRVVVGGNVLRNLDEENKMEKQLKPLSQYKAIYSFTFYLYKGRQSFQYLFMKKSTKIEVQRYPGRIYIQQKGNNCPNRIGTCYSNGNIQVYDKNSFNQLRISNITQNIFVGSYLKSSEDIKLLREKGITDILSIQTPEDYISHNLSPAFIQRVCQEGGINYHLSDIQDKNPRDFVKKSAKTFLKMDNILKNNGKIYVHCSAGMYRSPQIIALYLILVEQYTIESAIEIIKERHPFARPNYMVICSAIDEILCRHYKKGKKVLH